MQTRGPRGWLWERGAKQSRELVIVECAQQLIVLAAAAIMRQLSPVGPRVEGALVQPSGKVAGGRGARRQVAWAGRT